MHTSRASDSASREQIKRTPSSPLPRHRAVRGRPERPMMQTSFSRSILRSPLRVFCACVVIFALSTGGCRALVSYCRDTSPHSYSHPQAENICQTEGEYNYKAVTDKSNQNVLYDDIGPANVRNRFSAMTLADKLVAKYANMSDYIFHVEVMKINISARHHCCQLCQMDCEQFRYACPRLNVAADDNCSTPENLPKTCRFSESLLDVTVKLLCAIKKSDSRPIPDDWFISGFTLRTSPRNCPYRNLDAGKHYLLLATLSTPNYGDTDVLTGADMVVNVPKSKTSRTKLPDGYLRGVSRTLKGYTYLHSIFNHTCPEASAFTAKRSEASRDYQASWLLMASLTILGRLQLVGFL